MTRAFDPSRGVRAQPHFVQARSFALCASTQFCRRGRFPVLVVVALSPSNSLSVFGRPGGLGVTHDFPLPRILLAEQEEGGLGYPPPSKNSKNLKNLKSP